MSIIHALAEDIVAKIAAGEVIERPAYAIKELIDNAIDAKATQILITLFDAGLTKMIVEDDGVGMDAADVARSWKLHTTSKIDSIEELSSIRSQGFRGEALASIAATGELIIQSKPEGKALGYEIHVVNQKVVSEGKVGMPTGTRIIVEHLFESLPARKKFLQSQQTELRHCVEIVTNYAIAYPHIRFVLKHNGRLLLNVPTTKDPAERLSSLFDQKLTETLLPIHFQESYITIDGFIAHPSQASESLTKQFITINNRPIKDRLITRAIHDALIEILPKNKNPVFFIHLKIPVELVDVNVHPRKEIVHFSSPNTIYSALQTAVAEMLVTYSLTFQASLFDSQASGKITHSVAGNFLRESIQPSTVQIPKHFSCVQLHSTYIVFQTDNGVMFVDQHAAQERTLYEKLLVKFENEQKKKKTIPIRIRLPFMNADILLLEEYLKQLKTFGFSFEQTVQGKNQKMYITSVPALFSDRDPIPIIEELLSDIRDGLPIKSMDTLTHQMITYIACKGSVKAGDVLTLAQMKDIVQALQKVPNKFTCPHGRPTMIEVPLHQLHVLFKRL